MSATSLSTGVADFARVGLSRLQTLASSLTSTTSVLILSAATVVIYIRTRREAISETPVCVRDYEELARRALARRPTRGACEYFLSGAGDEVTKRRTDLALRRLVLLPRMLIDVSGATIAHTLLGAPTAAPFGIAPTAFHAIAHDDAEVAVSRAAANAGVVYCVSSSSSTPFEAVSQAAPHGRRLYQLYYRTSRALNEAILKSAEAAGAEAIVLTCVCPFNPRARVGTIALHPFHPPPLLLRTTVVFFIPRRVDRPVLGTRDANVRTKFTLPGRDPSDRNGNACAYHDSAISDALSWSDVSWMVRTTRLPIILKGILTGEDAALAVAAGVAGVWVSTHGGRQLDCVASSVEALREVIRAVRTAEDEASTRKRRRAILQNSPSGGPRVAVWVDGGVRRGTDIVKYLALGADFVWAGTAVICGLAVGGEAGVADVLRILMEETKTAMQLLGARSVAEISPAHVRAAEGE